MAARLTASTLLCALGVAGAFAVTTAASDPGPTSSTTTAAETGPVTVTVAASVQGRGVQWWARRARQNGRNARARGLTVARLKRTLSVSPSIFDAIALSSVVYGVSRATLFRKARCESSYSPAAHNPSGAMGLFQFLGSTWRTTPFGAFSPYDPLAASLAAGWMHRVGRGGEWVCQ